ncbi:DUF3515 domain-containing protein [Microbacterium pseudoresistens]|uniref:DUF3515 domain-containing protein n=1 Tax=Microbacterium pseudoresistens TaxID=640634 RepID=A0A7Y9JQ10_9MICO|nr:DUF3515 family protein [Microbacterium pseudoresistens]NYD55224.1 hypothetical protein [Microbacterium pseudoresistens]
MPRRLASAGLLVLAAGLLAGCSTTVHLEPADAANDPACADVSVRLNNVKGIGDLERRWTDAQATAAWGAPGEDSAVLLRCGLPKAQPTSELQCVTLEGVDWLVDDSRMPKLTLTSYGRDPAVQLFIDSARISANDVIANRNLVAAVTTIPAENRCSDPDSVPDDAVG